MVAGIVIASAIAALVTAIDRRQDNRDRENAEAHRVAVAIDAITSLSVAQLRAAAAFAEIHPGLRSAQFRRLTEALLSEQPMRSLAYIEAVPLAAGARTALRGPELAFPVRLTSDQSPEGRLIPASPAAGRQMVDALRRVRASGLPGVTVATRLSGSDEAHLILIHPVLPEGPDASGRRPSATAFTAGAVKVSDLLAAASAIVPAGTQLALVERDGKALAAGPVPGAQYASTPIVIADRSWELRIAIPGDEVWALPLLLGAAGLSLATLIGLLLFNWSRRERHALELAHVRLEERDRAMRLEAETNRMYRVLAENLTDLVMVSDPEARITYVSPAAERMLGWLPEEMVGRYVLEFLHEEDRDDSDGRLTELRSGAGILTFEHRLRRKDGSHVWAESAVRSIFDRNGERIIEFHSTTRDISERKPLQEQLERLAREDPLTGLANRRQFGEVMAAEAARLERSGGDCCLLLIDVDHFKHVNDAYGHLVGDRVLRQVAEVMRARMRASDTLARMGGDEFAAILPDTDAAEGSMVAAAVIAGIKEAFASEPDLPAITVSAGVAGFGAGAALTPEQIFERADLALYSAKAEGRDRLSVYGASAAGAEFLPEREDASG